MDFDHRHYVPILKAKRGEFIALSQLDPGVRQALSPVFEVQSVDWDWEDDVPRKTESDHLAAVIDSMVRYVGTADPFFVDLQDADLNPNVIGDSQGRHPYTFFFDVSAAKGLQAVPVLSLDADALLIGAVSGIVAQHGRGAMVRISREQMGASNLSMRLSKLLAALGLAASQTHLLLDVEDVDDSMRSAFLAWLPSVLGVLPAARTLTLAGCAFPDSIANFTRGSIGSVPRSEWMLWLALLRQPSDGLRLPTFGDYAICQMDVAELDPRTIKPVQNIRYTIDSEWLILRGQPLKGTNRSGPTTQQMCQTIIGQPQFCGAAFSAGDQHIVDCAAGQTGPGNLTTWRQVGTNHHLTFVVRQLATSLGASTVSAPHRAAP